VGVADVLPLITLLAAEVAEAVAVVTVEFLLVAVRAARV
jgi:hypothetical protein